MKKIGIGENLVEISLAAPQRDYALIFFYSPARCETTKLIVPALVCKNSLIFNVDTCLGPLLVGDYSMTVYLQDSNTNLDPLFAEFYYNETVQIRADICVKQAC